MSQRRKEIDSLFSEWDKTDSPGCMLAVIKKGKITYERGYGMANLEHSVPITSDSVFRIGSVSKQFTATCVAILAERGEISLDNGIRKYIPELPSFAETISIRHLIHQTSGIRDYTALFTLAMLTKDYRYFDNIAKSDVIDVLARQQQLSFKIGERYEYSNSNYFLLGLIVERVSGKSLRDFADEAIFKPLGMKNTHYHDDCKMVVTNRAYGYSPTDGSGFEISMSNCEVVGDGAVFTTINDLLLWDANFYNNILPGGSKLISTLEMVGRLNNGEPHSYAFGLFISEHKGLPFIYHGGGWVGFVAYMGRFPEQKFTVILLANVTSFPGDNLAKQVADIYLDQYIDKQEPVQHSEKVELEESDKITAKVLDELVGLHATPGGNLVEVSNIESNLSIQIKGSKHTRTTYAQVSKTRFQPVDGYITSILGIERFGNHNSYRIGTYNQDGNIPKWEPIPKIIPANERVDYAGYYYSKELDVTYWIKQTDEGILMCKTLSSWSGEFELYKLRKDELIFMKAQIIFKRNKQRIVTGFVLSSKDGVRGIRFRKRKSKTT